jgi:hypothetical protein
VRRIAITFAVVFLAVSALTVQAQEAEPASPVTKPAAVRSQADCTGFIAEVPVPHDLFVMGGADDDFRSVVRQFVAGESVFINKPNGGDVSVGTDYSVVRPAKELFRTMQYQGQEWDIRRLGQPYEDVAQIKVTHITPEGLVARITFSCEPIVRGDTVLPYQPRPIPDYTISEPLDHFMPLDQNKQHGTIVASHNNLGHFGRETAVYVNLGEKDGTLPGRRLRIYKVLAPETTGTLSKQATPPETVGEAVVLSVQSRTCVAIVVSSYREISAGDRVELE